MASEPLKRRPASSACRGSRVVAEGNMASEPLKPREYEILHTDQKGSRGQHGERAIETTPAAGRRAARPGSRGQHGERAIETARSASTSATLNSGSRGQHGERAIETGC